MHAVSKVTHDRWGHRRMRIDTGSVGSHLHFQVPQVTKEIFEISFSLSFVTAVFEIIDVETVRPKSRFETLMFHPF